MIAQTYKGVNGHTYTIEKEIGRGGEGTVSAIREDHSKVIKIYSDPLEKDKIEKLIYMASIQDAELNKFAAWPLDVIRDNSTNVVGFVMKKLEGYVPLHMLFSPLDRKKLFADKGYSFLIHVARNLAIAFHKIHNLNITIGDVNEANILVNSTGVIALIDCDSFQVRNGSHYYFCEVGIPRYTPPELLEKGTFEKVIRNEDTDSFSLATLIFQLLFLGRAPFIGINVTNEEIDEEKAIKNREFAYSLQRHNKKLLPAKNSLDLKSFTPNIIDLFHNAFEKKGIRPSPKEWIQGLDDFSKEIIICNQSKIHNYPKAFSSCPWCQFKEKVGIVYFLEDTYLKDAQEFSNIEQFINGYHFDKIEIKKLSEDYRTNNAVALPIEKSFKDLKNLHRGIIGIGIVIAILFYFVYWAMPIILFFIILIYNSISPFKKKLKEELEKRKLTFNTLKERFDSALKQHNNSPELQQYNDANIKLQKLITSFKTLSNEFDFKKKRIEESHYNLQYQTFLHQFIIKDHSIATFGSGKKLTLYNNGIRTAADITKLASIKISGIGPKNIQTLQTWQRQMGSAFAYIPDYTILNKEINLAHIEITNKKRIYEGDIKSAYKNIQYIKANIMAPLEAFERQYDAFAQKVYQAELDYNSFSSFLK